MAGRRPPLIDWSDPEARRAYNRRKALEKYQDRDEAKPEVQEQLRDMEVRVRDLQMRFLGALQQINVLEDQIEQLEQENAQLRRNGSGRAS